MKRDERYNNNKGAALISVMIAVTFITIVASALLYMAYMNFTMKTTSVKSKANFYETEGYLQGISVKLQDNIAKETSPMTYINTLKEGADSYNCQKILALKYPSATISGDASSSSVEIDGDTITLKRGIGAKYVETTDASLPKTKICRFEGITIEQTTPEGLTNNIKTDLVYYVTEESTTADAGGVGEFSMMCDAPLSAGGGFSFMTLYGNALFTDAEFDTGLNKTKPGDGAVILSNSDKINIAGKYCVVYGDIILNDNSCLTITSGNLCVYGDIYLNGNSSLICSGNIYMVDGVLPGRSENTKIISGNGPISKHLYPADLVVKPITSANFTLFEKEMNYHDSDATNDGIINRIIKKASLTDDAGHNFEWNYEDFSDAVKKSPISKYGMNYGWQMFKDGSGNASDFDNMLTFVIVKQLEIKDTSVNSTIISKFPVKYEQAHGVALKKIGPEAFAQLCKPMSDANHDTELEVTKSFGGHNNVKMTAGDFFDPNANKIVNTILGYSVNGEGGGTPVVLSSFKFEDWVKDSE